MGGSKPAKGKNQQQNQQPNRQKNPSPPIIVPVQEKSKENLGNETDLSDKPAPAAEDVQPDPLVNPFWLTEKAFEKKLRNLKKREQRLQEMKAGKEERNLKLEGHQIEAISKLDEIALQITFMEEIQKLNLKQMSQYKKAVKARDRDMKKQEKARSLASSTTPTPQQTDQEQLQTQPITETEHLQTAPKQKQVEDGKEEMKVTMVGGQEKIKTNMTAAKVPTPVGQEKKCNQKQQSESEKISNKEDKSDENKENIVPAATEEALQWGSGEGGW